MSTIQLETVSSTFLQDVKDGLSKPQKELPSKYFYDERGSELFEKICTLDEYYLTRAEMDLMETHIEEICSSIGKKTLLAELGSGSSMKTRLLLEHLDEIEAYIPVDISANFLKSTAESLQKEFPDLTVHPVAADYTRPFPLPFRDRAGRTVLYFPGSTIGNFTRERAGKFLGRMAGLLETDDGFLIGVDRIKDATVLEAAYNDKDGVTAQFNLNLLKRINRELGADFDLNQFKHHAFFNEEKSRIEMHLESLTDQSVTITGSTYHFSAGETIHTENSHKYSKELFEELVAGLYTIEKEWRDRNELFSLYYLRPLKN